MHAIEAQFPRARRFELFTGARSEDNRRLYERPGYRAFRTERLSDRVEIVYTGKPVGGTAGRRRVAVYPSGLMRSSWVPGGTHSQ